MYYKSTDMSINVRADTIILATKLTQTDETFGQPPRTDFESVTRLFLDASLV